MSFGTLIAYGCFVEKESARNHGTSTELILKFTDIPKAHFFCCTQLIAAAYLSFADNLLDDLQTTVTRTAEHLNSANTLKPRDVQFLAPSNSTTVVEERSSSPAGVSTFNSNGPRRYAKPTCVKSIAIVAFHLNFFPYLYLFV